MLLFQILLISLPTSHRPPAQSCSHDEAGAASPPLPGASPGTGALQNQRPSAENSFSSPASAEAYSVRALGTLQGFGPWSRDKVGPMSVGRCQPRVRSAASLSNAGQGNGWVYEDHSPQQGCDSSEAPSLSLEFSPKKYQQDRAWR